MTWEQPKRGSEQRLRSVEKRLQRHLEQFNAWRGHVGAHYPVTLRMVCAALTAAGPIAPVLLLLLSGVPLGPALILGVLLALIVCVPLSAAAILIWFYPYPGCGCNECKGGMR